MAIGLAGVAYSYARGEEEANRAPRVGECAHKIQVDEIEKVDCESAEADFRVTSRHEDTANGEIACASDPQATAAYEFDATSHGVSVRSFVLCLAAQ